MINENAQEPATASSSREKTSPWNSKYTADYVQNGLFQQLRRNIGDAQRLHQQSALIKEELRELIHGRSQPEQRQRQSVNNSLKPVIVHFPATAFTIEDLERANVSVDPAVVRFQLGVALSRRRVEFILPDQSNGSASKTVRYRKTYHSVHRVPHMKGLVHNRY